MKIHVAAGLALLFALQCYGRDPDPDNIEGYRKRPDRLEASQNVGGPRLGFVFDGTVQSFRPILGIPGAATLGEPLNLQSSLIRAAVSRDQERALGVSAGDKQLLQIDLVRGAAYVVPGALSDPDRLVFSPDGLRAAVYSGAEGKLQSIEGLRGTAAVTREVDLSGLTGTLTALAISTSGIIAAATLSDDGVGQVYVIDSAEVQPVLAVKETPSLAFAGESRDLLIADSGDNAVYLMRDVGGSSSVAVLASGADGLTGPSAISFSAKLKRAVVASAHSLSLLDLDGAPALTIEYSESPKRIDELGSSGVFRLSDVSDQPLWLLDLDGIEPRLLFVPPASNAVARAPIERLQRSRE